MKYVARIKEVLRPGIHRVAQIVDGNLTSGEVLREPDRVEISIEAGGTSCFMYRYTRTGEFCGDTWHATLDDAVAQAQFEFGLKRSDFVEVIEGSRS